MARAAKVVAAPDTAERAQAAPRVFARYPFAVWHRDQHINVPAGQIKDPALLKTLLAMPDQSMLDHHAGATWEPWP